MKKKKHGNRENGLIYQDPDKLINMEYWKNLIKTKLKHNQTKKQNKEVSPISTFELSKLQKPHYDDEGMRFYVDGTSEDFEKSLMALRTLIPGCFSYHGLVNNAHFTGTLDTSGNKTLITIPFKMQQNLDKKSKKKKWWRKNRTIIETYLIIFLICMAFFFTFKYYQHIVDYRDRWEIFKTACQNLYNFLKQLFD